VRAHLPAGCFPRGEKRQADVNAGAVELECGGGGAGEYGVVGMGERKGRSKWEMESAGFFRAG